MPADGSVPKPETVAWAYDAEGDIAVVDGTVYVRTDDEVHALDDETGELQWITEDIGADGTPAVTADTVFVGGEQLTALEAETGEVRWQEQFDEEAAVPSPAVAFERAYVVVGETLYAFDTADGSVDWKRSTVQIETGDGNENVSFKSIPLAVANDLVYAAVGDAGFVALEATSGETNWTYWWKHSTDPHGYLVATTDRLYTGAISDADESPVLNAQTGERLANTSFRFPLAVTDNVRARTNRHSMRVSNYETDESWSIGGSTDQWGRPVIVGETVVVPSHPMADERAIFAFDLADGSRQWALGLDSLDINTLDEMNWPSDAFVATEDTIYITSPGQIVALRPSTGAQSDEGDDTTEEETDAEDPEEDDPTDERAGNSSEDDTEQVGDERTDGDDDVSELEEVTTDSENVTSSTSENTTAADSNDSTDGSANGSTNGNETEPTSESGTTDGNESSNASTASNSNSSVDGNSTEGADDSTPGFTGGTGLVGAGLAIEWLRRRSSADKPAVADELDD
ncbi:outer membrane protein assembly factor BamB family protein [Halostagnicola larsenii]|uniref:outer membrane protein assembly factor BamB family protein n=1 Tax=Halostagnicola larsenii TaxID=353800 RepID=UPI00146FB9F0|nr:PQQ-binding-like beta-propeller repeat protein [Halostagnicola larsenii]